MECRFQTLCISALSLIYSAAGYCSPVWCGSTHTRFIDNILNDALRIVTGCLRPTLTEDLPVLAGSSQLISTDYEQHSPWQIVLSLIPTMYCTDSWLGSRMRTWGDLEQDAHLYLLRGNYLVVCLNWTSA